MIRSLVYEVEHDKLTETYSIITKTRNQALLQVVNDVNINQGLMEKILDSSVSTSATGSETTATPSRSITLQKQKRSASQNSSSPKKEPYTSNNKVMPMPADKTVKLSPKNHKRLQQYKLDNDSRASTK